MNSSTDYARFIFPAILFCCNLGSAIMCLRARDVKGATYWLASAVCVGVVAIK